MNIALFRNILLMLIIVMSAEAVSAQTDTTNMATPQNPIAPNMDAIERSISDRESPFFYPDIFSRYIKGDTTLTLEDYRHLYYGYVYNVNYEPLVVRNYADSVVMTLAKNRKDSVIEADLFNDIIYYTQRMLETEPFNLSFINIITYIYQTDGDIEEAMKYSYKLRMIKNTIFSSGTGISKDSPWHILYRTDITDILNSLGARYSRKLYVTKDCEYYHLPVKNDGIRGYYFDISRLYLKPIEFEGKRKMEFNPYQNPKSKKYIGNPISY